MDVFKWYFQQQIPNYLKSLPLPTTVGGFAALTREQWLQLAPFLLFLVLVVWLLFSPILSPLCTKKKPRPKHIINKKVDKSEPKVKFEQYCLVVSQCQLKVEQYELLITQYQLICTDTQKALGSPYLPVPCFQVCDVM